MVAVMLLQGIGVRKENEFWPCLLEKAVAKLVKAYYRIDGGFEQIALEMCLLRLKLFSFMAGL